MDTYQLLDTGDQQRLEQWGPYRIIRPEPTAQWARQNPPAWQTPDAIFQGATAGQGTWEQHRPLPVTWSITLGRWQFAIGLGSSKHLGLFPEQLVQWQLLYHRISGTKTTNDEPVRCLNLFAHTGAASIAAATAGAYVTHVDSSAPAIGRAKENQALNSLDSRSIRWIRDDVLSFVQREHRRGKQYELIVLDPPAYGHGAKNKRFILQKQLPLLLREVQKILSEKAIGVLLTVYTNDISPNELAAECNTVFTNAVTETNHLGLEQESSNRLLTTGSWAYIQLR